MKIKDKLKRINKKLVLSIVLAILLCICFFYLGKYQSNKEMHNSLSMLEGDFLEYSKFKIDLDKVYPYYEPDGGTYKDIIGELYDKKVAEAEKLYQEVIKSIPDEIEWERDDGTTFMHPPTSLIVREDLKKLHPIFPKYRNLICNLRTEVWQGGSGSNIGVTLCELYEIEKYTQLLKFYHKWFAE